MANRNAYEERIEPRLNDIAEWAKKGVTERSMAEQLGVSYSTFNKYKAMKTELSQTLKRNRNVAVEAIENAVYRKAIGFQYKEEKRIDRDGVVTVETYTKTALPDTTAAIFLLKHWGKDRGYTNDPATLELKKKELELKERELKNKEW